MKGFIVDIPTLNEFRKIHICDLEVWQIEEKVTLCTPTQYVTEIKQLFVGNMVIKQLNRKFKDGNKILSGK